MTAPVWRLIVASDLPYPCSDPDCDSAAVHITHVSVPSEDEPMAITSCGEHVVGMAFAASAVMKDGARFRPEVEAEFAGYRKRIAELEAAIAEYERGITP